MRTFTEPGRRVLPHCTGVGKALLAQLPTIEVRAILGRTGLPAQTDQTITDLELMLAELEKIRRDGYALDSGEQEVGVRCIAAAVPRAPGLMAISVSGPQARMSEADVERIAPVLKAAAARLGESVHGDS